MLWLILTLNNNNEERAYRTSRFRNWQGIKLIVIGRDRHDSDEHRLSVKPFGSSLS